MSFTVIPTSYSYRLYATDHANGSSISGHCATPPMLKAERIRYTCHDPKSSVLFDAKIPPILPWPRRDTAWASELLVLNGNGMKKRSMYFNFTGQADYTGVEAVEVAVFNCPMFGASIESIVTSRRIKIPISKVSCKSLVRQCVPLKERNLGFALEFRLSQRSRWMHLAEIEFHRMGHTCKQNATPTTPTSLENNTTNLDIPEGEVELAIGKAAHTLISSFTVIFYEIFNSESNNGSSTTGHCKSTSGYFRHNAYKFTCTEPNSSVLFDNKIPTLTGLDGETWAEELLTLGFNNRLAIHLDPPKANILTETWKIVVVLFNCPQWGISVEKIVIDSKQVGLGLNITSCQHLVRVCRSYESKGSSFNLTFEPFLGSAWVHIAEIILHKDNTCPPDTVLEQFPLLHSSTLQPSTDGDMLKISTTQNYNATKSTTTTSTTCSCGEAGCKNMCPSHTSMAAILGSCIPLTLLAITAAVIFVMSILAISKYCLKRKEVCSRILEDEKIEENTNIYFNT